MGSLVYFLLWGAAIFLMMRFGCGAHIMGHGHSQTDKRTEKNNASVSGGPLAAPPESAVDPVCHLKVATATAKSSVYDGHVHYFCSQECRATFEIDPQSKLGSVRSMSTAGEPQHAV